MLDCCVTIEIQTAAPIITGFNGAVGLTESVCEETESLLERLCSVIKVKCAVVSSALLHLKAPCDSSSERRSVLEALLKRVKI